jgi:hypothetical protein
MAALAACCIILLVCIELLCPAVAAQREGSAVPFMAQNRDEIRGPGVRLHRPDGSTLYINAKAVAFVRSPLATESGNATIVFTGGATQSVEESVEIVIKLIAAELEEY